MTDKIDGRKIVYGSLVIYEGGLNTHWINPLGGQRNYPVEEDSVSQLIAVDKNGNEVYEGDKVIRVAGEDFNPEKAFPFYADFRDYGAIIDGEIVLVGGRCKECGKAYFPKEPMCNACLSTDFEEIEISKYGTLESYSVVYRQVPGRGFPVPHAVGVVKVPEKVRVAAPDLQAGRGRHHHRRLPLPRLEYRGKKEWH